MINPHQIDSMSFIFSRASTSTFEGLRSIQSTTSGITDVEASGNYSPHAHLIGQPYCFLLIGRRYVVCLPVCTSAHPGTWLHPGTLRWATGGRRWAHSPPLRWHLCAPSSNLQGLPLSQSPPHPPENTGSWFLIIYMTNALTLKHWYDKVNGKYELKPDGPCCFCKSSSS